MSQQETNYTSTGAKFWRHQQALYNYRAGDPATIIATHVSPTSACNLNCPFCSVSKRHHGNSTPLSTIKLYIRTLKRYGLKAVILTGGGEPLLYEHINELVGWLAYEEHLEVALITNGTACDSLRPDRWGLLQWVRVSLNAESIDRVNLATEYINPDAVTGCSLVYVGRQGNRKFLQDCKVVATALAARYVRVLPDCMLQGDDLARAHAEIADALAELDDQRFFHQHKTHGTVKAAACHQSRFRPYLSEEGGGTVFPCDSLVLNNQAARFAERFKLCSALEVEAWLRREIVPGFDPRTDCTGCVFADTVNMLDDWQRGTVDRFDDYREPMQHENFV